MKTSRKLLCLVLTLFWAASASAHRAEVPVTTIEWNARTNLWEVSHRLSAHDVENVLGHGADLGTLTPVQLNEKIGRYIQSKFTVLGIMFLEFVGVELEGDNVWAYFELRGWDQMIIISSRLLDEANATAATLVNIKSGNEVQSIRFDDQSGWQSIKLQRPTLKRAN